VDLRGHVVAAEYMQQMIHPAGPRNVLERLRVLSSMTRALLRAKTSASGGGMISETLPPYRSLLDGP
jgi:hypothetical protein